MSEPATVAIGIYEDAVRGRRAFRQALRRQLKRSRQLETALEACLTAMNPSDRSGISLHEWNRRLKAATEQGHAALAAAEPETPR